MAKRDSKDNDSVGKPMDCIICHAEFISASNKTIKIQDPVYDS